MLHSVASAVVIYQSVKVGNSLHTCGNIFYGKWDLEKVKIKVGLKKSFSKKTIRDTVEVCSKKLYLIKCSSV